MKDVAVTDGVFAASDDTETLRLRDYVQILLVTVVIALMLKACVIEAFLIPTASMANTLHAGDFLLVNKFVYGARTPGKVPFTNVALPAFRFPGLTSPRRGDVVVFELPPYARRTHAEDNDRYVKRCIALPGDTLLIRNRRVFVNGEELLVASARISSRHLLPEGFGDPRIFPKGTTFNEDQYGPLVIPRRGDTVRISSESFLLWKDVIAHEGHHIVLDSTGSVVIDGKKQHHYVISTNYYFMMGDNRDDSSDSRFWGFVPEDALIGKAMLIYWSWDDSREETTNPLHRIRWERIGTVIR